MRAKLPAVTFIIRDVPGFRRPHWSVVTHHQLTGLCIGHSPSVDRSLYWSLTISWPVSVLVTHHQLTGLCIGHSPSVDRSLYWSLTISWPVSVLVTHHQLTGLCIGHSPSVDRSLYWSLTISWPVSVFQVCIFWSQPPDTILQTHTYRSIIITAQIHWDSHWLSSRSVSACLYTFFYINFSMSILSFVIAQPIMKLMRRLTWCAAKGNFVITAKHIPGIHNDIADALSRFQMSRFRELAPGAALMPCPCPTPAQVMWY